MLSPPSFLIPLQRWLERGFFSILLSVDLAGQMQRILPTARVGAAILLRVSPRAANRTVNSPYCDPDGATRNVPELDRRESHAASW